MDACFRRLATTLLLATACASFFSPTARADDSLYQALGEKAGLTQITNDFVANVFADPRTKTYFAGVSQKRLKEKLFEQFCVLAGGPCVYTGHSMKQAHAGLNIDRAAFNAVVEDLQKAMDKNNVPFHQQNKLLAKLAPMHREIEERE